MHLYVLGPLQLRSGAGEAIAPTGAKQRLLLGTLVLNAPRPVSSERLADLLWGDDPPADPGAALRTQLSRLRSLLRHAGLADRLRRGVAGCALQLDAAEIDAGAFEALHPDRRRYICVPRSAVSNRWAAACCRW